MRLTTVLRAEGLSGRAGGVVDDEVVDDIVDGTAEEV